MTQSMLLTLGLAIAGQILYQIEQRSVPIDASPPVVLALAYFAASALCVALTWIFGVLSQRLSSQSRSVSRIGVLLPGCVALVGCPVRVACDRLFTISSTRGAPLQLHF